MPSSAARQLHGNIAALLDRNPPQHRPNTGNFSLLHNLSHTIAVISTVVIAIIIVILIIIINIIIMFVIISSIHRYALLLFFYTKLFLFCHLFHSSRTLLFLWFLKIIINFSKKLTCLRKTSTTFVLFLNSLLLFKPSIKDY